MSHKKLHWTQRIKAEKLKLQMDLREVVLNPDSVRAKEIVTYVKFDDAREK